MRVQHPGKEPVNRPLPVNADRALLACGQESVDLDARRRGLFVGIDRVTCVRTVREIKCLPRSRTPGLRHRSEMSVHELFNGSFVKITNRDNGHQVRPVPVFVVLLYPLCLGVLDDFRFADGKPVRITRSFEHHRKYLFHIAHTSAATRTPFLQHYATFLFDLGSVERDILRPVLEHLKRLFHCAGLSVGTWSI